MPNIFIFLLLFLSSSFGSTHAHNNIQQKLQNHTTTSRPTRETLGIVIGGSPIIVIGESPTPSPDSSPVCPPPVPPPTSPPPPPPLVSPPPPPRVSPPPRVPSPPPPPPPPPSPSPSPRVPPPPPPPPSPSPRVPSPPPPPPPSPSPRSRPRPRPRPSPPSEPRIERDRKVIQEFAKRIEHDPKGIKKTWTGRNACDYTGFQCTFYHKYSQAVLYSVQFNGYNFSGKNLGIDNFINNLSDVSIFHANSNNFHGHFPDLSKLPLLYELDLSNNKYVSEFPFKVLEATQLVFLDLRFNTFSGRVPPEIFNLQVVVLFINNNDFEQELPSNMGFTPAAFITFANNKFTGQIPKSIGHASETLLEILFLKNKLTGCLPYEIGLLKKARVFDVSMNFLTGPIPHSFACLGEMQYLVLAQNEFYGPVPEQVCKLPKLKNFTLSYNYFTQAGPACMELIRKKVLDVKMNCILGLPNQRSPQECAWFFKKPKYCPEAHTYNYIPCKGRAAYLNSDVALEGAPLPQPALSYGSLSP